MLGGGSPQHKRGTVLKGHSIRKVENSAIEAEKVEPSDSQGFSHLNLFTLNRRCIPPTVGDWF